MPKALLLNKLMFSATLAHTGRRAYHIEQSFLTTQNFPIRHQKEDEGEASHEP